MKNGETCEKCGQVHEDCTAHNRAGGPCGNPPSYGFTVCDLHGGKTPVGPLSPHWETGKFSKHLPPRMRIDYQAALADTALLGMSEEVAIIEGRLKDVMARVDTGESGEIWEELRETVLRLEAAERLVNSPKDHVALKAQAEVAACYAEIKDLAKDGAEDWSAWNEVKRLATLYNKLKQNEQKRQIAMKEMMTRGQALALVAAIDGIIQHHVRDRSVCAAISAELIGLLPRSPVQKSLPGS